MNMLKFSVAALLVVNLYNAAYAGCPNGPQQIQPYDCRLEGDVEDGISSMFCTALGGGHQVLDNLCTQKCGAPAFANPGNDQNSVATVVNSQVRFCLQAFGVPTTNPIPGMEGYPGFPSGNPPGTGTYVISENGSATLQQVLQCAQGLIDIFPSECVPGALRDEPKPIK